MDKDTTSQKSLLVYDGNGKNYRSPQFDIISWLFLRGLGFIFFAAFLSFSSQALGLIGSHGIAPIHEFTQLLQTHLGAERYWYLPMIFWLNTSDTFIQVTCWIGMLFSLLLIFNIFPRIALCFLYFLYLSLTHASQVFMAFQWDLFLLETSIIAIFLVSGNSLGIWLLRWLLFRFIFAAGLVKIVSGEPSWRDLSTLHYYFSTQPLPTPLAWYANQLPHSVLKAGTFLTLFVELVIPFLIFLPRRLRFFAVFSIIFLQLLIMLTGNYNFFNLLTLLLCITAFDDASIKILLPQRLCHWLTNIKSASPLSTKITYPFAILTVLLSIIQFELHFLGFSSTLLSKINNTIAPLRIVNLYGPFAVITKERMEIIIEGSYDGTNWKEYNFKYKPGNIYRGPSWNIPHQPRLDWQMWFASLSTPEENPWFTRLLERLLENSPTVLELFEKNPFPNLAPRFIRADFYEYQFSTSEEKSQTGAYWNRRLVRSYFLSVHLSNTSN